MPELPEITASEASVSSPFWSIKVRSGPRRWRKNGGMSRAGVRNRSFILRKTKSPFFGVYKTTPIPYQIKGIKPTKSYNCYLTHAHNQRCIFYFCKINAGGFASLYLRFSAFKLSIIIRNQIGHVRSNLSRKAEKYEKE